MAKKNHPVTVSVPAVAAYAWLARPDEGQEYSDGKYKVTLVFDPTDPDTKKYLGGLSKMIKEIAKGEEFPDSFKSPIKDGNEAKNEEFHGKFTLVAKTKYQPGFVDTSKKPLVEDNYPASGDIIRASFALIPYNAGGNKGVACQLRNVMLLEKRNVGGSPTADFDEIEAVAKDTNTDDDDFDIAI
jgi:hypothetical protein|tara:strand:+ start:7321 stop:7875 length:555 start_codon:yes stop_codon:yes gene_type:complete